MADKFLAMHALAIKKFGTADAVAAVIGEAAGDVAPAIEEAVGAGEAISGKGAYMLTPKGQAALKAAYPAVFAAQRGDAAFTGAYDRFEAVNRDLKQVITDWQTMEVAGEQVPNDHSDADYDAGVIDRLGGLHERAEPVLKQLAAALPRLQRYLERLEAALDKVEGGDTAWVSGAKIDSYHTVWFELHEDLLRILERERDD
ncbi:MAG: hypothetical protein RIB84_17485 [Sneathiellaceae bacterium]